MHLRFAPPSLPAQSFGSLRQRERGSTTQPMAEPSGLKMHAFSDGGATQTLGGGAHLCLARQVDGHAAMIRRAPAAD